MCWVQEIKDVIFYGFTYTLKVFLSCCKILVQCRVVVTISITWLWVWFLNPILNDVVLNVESTFPHLIYFPLIQEIVKPRNVYSLINCVLKFMMLYLVYFVYYVRQILLPFTIHSTLKYYVLPCSYFYFVLYHIIALVYLSSDLALH